MTTVAAHYDAVYFDWQRQIGAFGAREVLSRFQPHIRPSDRVLDFGCGGGYLLTALTCGERCGVEVNPAARAEAKRNGVSAVASASEVPDAWADVIISNSTLEHVEHPLGELRALYLKLKPGGKIVFGVPNETLGSAYKPGDINQHLYCWSPMNIGNLLTVAGYQVESVTVWRCMWPPHYMTIDRLFGRWAFHAISWAYRLVRLALHPLKPVVIHASIVAVARKPVHVSHP